MYSKNAWEKYSSEELKAVLDFSEGYKNFITVGKTERLCVSESERLAKENGFPSLPPVFCIIIHLYFFIFYLFLLVFADFSAFFYIFYIKIF